ncbi:MAG: metallophosphoesterase, partial [Acidobacteriota bacterium]
MLNRGFSTGVAAVFVLAVAMLALPAAQGRGGGRRGGAAAEMPLSTILGRPTDESITLSVLAPSALDAFVEYGTTTGAYNSKTTVASGPARVPFEITLTGLKPDTRYFYRLQQRAAGQKDFTAMPEQSFMTMRAAGSTFSFGVQGDSHPERDQRMYDAELYRRTMDRVRSERPDLYVMLGDDFSIERLIASNTTSQDTVNQVYADQRAFLTRMAASTSLFLVNGNHEEAARFLLNGTPNNPAVFAGKARTAYYPLPAPDRFYTGDAEPVDNIGLLRDYYA